MVDDLTIQGVSEPYRMLTARSEHRLHLRADNAVSRLGPMALALGALGADQRRRVEDRLEAKQSAVNALEQRVTGTELGVADVDRRSLAEWARRGVETLSAVRARLPSGEESMEALDDAIYAPYLERQKHELAARHASRATTIPASFDYAAVPGLSTEMRERLSVAGPANLDQAGRVPGVTPAALSALHFALVRAAA
jgi:tRNA uridine 5-carboxymethylaminomethyl modification enzyme